MELENPGLSPNTLRSRFLAFSLIVSHVNLLRDDLISSLMLHTPQKTALSECVTRDDGRGER